MQDFTAVGSTQYSFENAGKEMFGTTASQVLLWQLISNRKSLHKGIGSFAIVVFHPVS